MCAVCRGSSTPGQPSRVVGPSSSRRRPTTAVSVAPSPAGRPSAGTSGHVLPGSPGRLGPGRRGGTGRGPGRVAFPPLLHGRHGKPHAGLPCPPRLRPLLPVAEQLSSIRSSASTRPTCGPWAKDRRSLVVAHRHRILDKFVVGGDVRLMVAVGEAAKESVATWRLWATARSATPHRGGPGGLDHERSPRADSPCASDARRWSAWALNRQRDGLRPARNRLPVGAGCACPAEVRARREAGLVVRDPRSGDGEHHGRLVAASAPPTGGAQQRGPCRLRHRLVDHRPARRSAWEEGPLTGMR